MKAGSIFAVFLGLVFLLAACASSAPSVVSPTTGSPPASPSSTPPPSTTTPPLRPTQGGPYIGLPADFVDSILAIMKANLGVEVIVTQENFHDPVLEKDGVGQVLTAQGTGNDFASPAITAQIIASILENDGWKVAPQLQADGPTGTSLGYRKDKALALIEVVWSPAEGVTVDPNQPIEAQEIPPDQQLYKVRLSLATLSS